MDADSGLVHTVVGTAANVNDVTQGHGLLHGHEDVVFADAGYQGAMKRKDATGVPWQVAMRPGKRRALDKSNAIDALTDILNTAPFCHCSEPAQWPVGVTRHTSEEKLNAERRYWRRLRLKSHLEI